MNKKDLAAILDLMEGDSDLHPAQRRRKRRYAEPYPDFSKGMTAQYKGDPLTSAITSGLGYGSLGGILGGIGGYLTDEDNSYRNATIGAVIGSLLGGGAGAYSGYRGQESRNSELNALKRLGIDTPMEYKAMEEYPALVRKLTVPDYKGGYV